MSTLIDYMKKKFTDYELPKWEIADMKRLFTHLRRHFDDRDEYEVCLHKYFKDYPDYCGDESTISCWLDNGCVEEDFWNMETGCRDEVLYIAVDWLKTK